MSMRFKGGLISATPPTISPPVGGEGGSASGAWTLQSQLQNAAVWPKPFLLGLFTWGLNNNGQLGHDDRATSENARKLGGSEWDNSQISLRGNYAAAVKSDGTLWTWGNNTGGALGSGSFLTAQRSSPVQVGALTNWAKVIGYGPRKFAVKTDGTLWSWGRNEGGELGLNDVNDRNSPVQVGTDTNWAEVYPLHAIKTNGTLWAIGGGGFNASLGLLGLNDVVARSSPVQVGALTNWSKMSSEGQFAIKTDGTIWSWGSNNVGQAGQNDRGVYRSSPTQIGALTSWVAITSAGARKNDGTLWLWGASSHGALGNGVVNDGFPRSSPVQLGSDTDWSWFNRGGSSNFAIKTNGTLWGWGRNDYGQLGLGYSSGGASNQGVGSPTRVGAATTWYAAYAGSAASGLRE
jgi:alpha-tubulin suppressor-like RCC1 family protein